MIPAHTPSHPFTTRAQLSIVTFHPVFRALNLHWSTHQGKIKLFLLHFWRLSVFLIFLLSYTSLTVYERVQPHLSTNIAEHKDRSGGQQQAFALPKVNAICPTAPLRVCSDLILTSFLGDTITSRQLRGCQSTLGINMHLHMQLE